MLPGPYDPHRLDMKKSLEYNEEYIMSIKKVYENIWVGIYSNQDGSQFYKDATEALEIQDNPKKDALYGLAWEYGHSTGYVDIFAYMIDLVSLIK